MLMVVTAAALFIVVMVVFMLMAMLVVVTVGVMMSLLNGSDYYAGFDGVCDLVDLFDKFIGEITLYFDFFHGEVKHSRLDTFNLADSFLYFSTAVSAVQI